MNNKIAMAVGLALLPGWLHAATLLVTVTDSEGTPLPGATVQLGDGRGAAGSLEGKVKLEGVSGAQVLRVSCVGYETRKLELNLPADGVRKVDVKLVPGAQALADLSVTGVRETGMDLARGPATERMAADEARALAMDGTARSALGALAGVDTRPCALCGSAGVGLQGLDPNYTEVRSDGLALTGGVGALYGLDAVGVGGLSSLSVTRGATSVSEGGGAVAGSVQLASRRPDGQDTLQVRAFLGDGWRHGAGFTLGNRLGGLPLLLGLDWAADPRRLDRNNDGLTDTPQLGRLGGQASLAGETNGGGWSLRAGVTHEHRFAGDTDWEDGDAGSAHVYGRDIRIRRGELRLAADGEAGLRRKWSAAAGAVSHHQDSWYGLTRFDARQRLLVGQVQVEQRWLNGQTARLQAAYSDDLYEDGLDLPTDRHDRVPSLAASQGGMWGRSSFEAGLRVEKREEGWIPLLRGTVAREPLPGWTARLSASQGYRPVTLFSLDKAVHAGFDHVELPAALDPERSLSLNLGLQHKLVVGAGRWQGDVSLFAVEFRDKALLRYTAEAGHLVYGNAEQAYSRGVELRADWLDQAGWHLAAHGTWSKVMVKLPEGWEREELAGAWTAGATLGKRGWGRFGGLGAELRLRSTGPQVMPAGRGRDKTPVWSVLDLGLDHRAAAWSVGLDVENLLDYVQPDNPLVQGAEHEGMLDSALIYGPLVGRRFRVRGEISF